MGWYARLVFPRLCNLLLDGPIVRRHRRRLLGAAIGNVLEIGFGSGLNLPCYPPTVRTLVAVDPNPGMIGIARRRRAAAPFPVRPCASWGERLPFPDGVFDCVVSTFTLCSIADPAAAIGEAYRVLRHGGRFLLLEHGLCPDPLVQRWQRRLTPLQRWLGDGCRLDRNHRSLVAAHPFAHVQIDEFLLQGTPRTHGYLYQGAAVKAGPWESADAPVSASDRGVARRR